MTLSNTDSLPNILADLLAEEKLTLACNILGKSESDYEHLDRGRKAMTGGNMLRNALKKDDALLARIAEEAARLVATRDPSLVLAPKKESSEKRTTPSQTGAHIRENEKNWGKREQPEWIFDEKEIARLEAVYLEDEKLRAEGKLPPRNLLVSCTNDTIMIFNGEPTPKYHSTTRKPKGRLTVR